MMRQFVIPLITGIIGFFVGVFQSTLKEWSERRKYSKLGVSIIDTLIEEIDQGINILQAHSTSVAMPNSSWQGMDTIPNEILLRVISLDKGEKLQSKDFPISAIKIHCKNYFVNICGNVNNGVVGRTYLDDAKKVKRMLVKARDQLDCNSRRWVFTK